MAPLGTAGAGIGVATRGLGLAPLRDRQTGVYELVQDPLLLGLPIGNVPFVSQAGCVVVVLERDTCGLNLDEGNTKLRA